MQTYDYLLLTDVPDMVSRFVKVYSLQYSVLMPVVNKQQYYCNSVKSLKILLEVNFLETYMDQCLMSS